MVGLRGTDTNQTKRVIDYRSGKIPLQENIGDFEISQTNSSTEIIVSQIKQKQKRFTAEEVTELLKDYKAGLTVYQLGDKYGCHRTTVSEHLKANGIKMRGTRTPTKIKSTKP
jgi:reverse gyrase